MSIELIEQFVIRTGVPNIEDIGDDDIIPFEFNDSECVLESIHNGIKIIIDDNHLITDDIDEAVDFFESSFGIDERESAIVRLENELRSEFRR